jgi:hypothetical protein
LNGYLLVLSAAAISFYMALQLAPLGRDTTAPITGRGSPNWSAQTPIAGNAPSLLDAQAGTFEKDFKNPYTERWSFGFQRQLASKLVLDGSYVGSESHRLATWADDWVTPVAGLNVRPSISRLQNLRADRSSVN